MVCSVALLQPLLSEEAQKLPEWQCWLAHIRVMEMATRLAYTLADMAVLDNLIQEHHALFLKVSISPMYGCVAGQLHMHMLNVSTFMYMYRSLSILVCGNPSIIL